MHIVVHFNRYSAKYDVVASGEQTFFILTSDKGSIRYQRRLDYQPSCLKTYHLPTLGSDIVEDEERVKD